MHKNDETARRNAQRGPDVEIRTPAWQQRLGTTVAKHDDGDDRHLNHRRSDDPDEWQPREVVERLNYLGAAPAPVGGRLPDQLRKEELKDQAGARDQLCRRQRRIAARDPPDLMRQCRDEERQERRCRTGDPDAAPDPTAFFGEHPRDRVGAHAWGRWRHKAGDQGEPDKEDRSENDSAPNAKTLLAFRHHAATV